MTTLSTRSNKSPLEWKKLAFACQASTSLDRVERNLEWVENVESLLMLDIYFKENSRHWLKPCTAMLGSTPREPSTVEAALSAPRPFLRCLSTAINAVQISFPRTKIELVVNDGFAPCRASLHIPFLSNDETKDGAFVGLNERFVAAALMQAYCYARAKQA